MRRELVARLGLGLVALCALGSAAGMGLANYTTSGSFDFYRQQRVAEWQPEPPASPATLQSTDLAFASDRPGAAGKLAPEGAVASLDP